jgi:hypothetical protein
MKATLAIPPDWKALLAPNCPVGFGLDPATTEKATSNPSGFACVQKVGNDFVVVLAARWKTSDPEVARQILRSNLQGLPFGLRPRRLVVDASNEKYFATDLRTHLRGVCPVELVSSTENIQYRGETMPMKVYLGNLLVNTLEDGHLILPQSDWLAKDMRLVKRDRGSFATDIDNAGGHGDVFDAIKNALHALISRGGPAQAAAIDVTGRDSRPDDDDDFTPQTGLAL